MHITSDFSEDALIRYRLKVEDPSKADGKTLCVIMQNPSLADNERADKSVQFLETLVFEKDYDELKDVKNMIIVNQFAFVQTHGFVGMDEQIGTRNNLVISEAIEAADIVLIAWGKNNPFEGRKKFVFELLADARNKTVLQTKKHPSRGFYKDFIKPLELTELQG